MKIRNYLLLLSLILTCISISCWDRDDDPCEGVICYNGGSCLLGRCECPEGYYGEQCQFKKPEIGDILGGGIVFYVDGTGEHGLIAAAFDQGSLIPWGCTGMSISEAMNSSIQAGENNTTAIYSLCGEPGSAAVICSELTLNDYNDWCLPSQDELNLLYQNKDIVLGFNGEWYWSSTEFSSTKAYKKNFITGVDAPDGKSSKIRVRAIRYF